MKTTPQFHLTKANKDIINFCFENKTEYAQTKGNKYEVRKINAIEQIERLNEAVKSLGDERTLEICAYLAVIKIRLEWLETNKEKEIYIFKHNGKGQYFYIN
jgi:hypothetical protein